MKRNSLSIEQNYKRITNKEDIILLNQIEINMIGKVALCPKNTNIDEVDQPFTLLELKS